MNGLYPTYYRFRAWNAIVCIDFEILILLTFIWEVNVWLIFWRVITGLVKLFVGRLEKIFCRTLLGCWWLYQVEITLVEKQIISVGISMLKACHHWDKQPFKYTMLTLIASNVLQNPFTLQELWTCFIVEECINFQELKEECFLLSFSVWGEELCIIYEEYKWSTPYCQIARGSRQDEP